MDILQLNILQVRLRNNNEQTTNINQLASENKVQFDQLRFHITRLYNNIELKLRLKDTFGPFTKNY